jgi:hypothetical protein
VERGREGGREGRVLLSSGVIDEPRTGQIRDLFSPIVVMWTGQSFFPRNARLSTVECGWELSTGILSHATLILEIYYMIIIMIIVHIRTIDSAIEHGYPYIELN